MCNDGPRITDLSSLEPENFKFRNTDFLMGDAHYDVLAHQNREELRRRIWHVRNGDLQRVLDDFPTNEPLVEQCALWMHAVVGKHFFPDANHRTAIALLRRHYAKTGSCRVSGRSRGPEEHARSLILCAARSHPFGWTPSTNVMNSTRYGNATSSQR